MNQQRQPTRSETVLSREQVKNRIDQLRAQGKKIGFTSGTFDLLHIGHVCYLEGARQLCDTLVVGVNSDRSVKSYKDPGRPFVPQTERAALVAALYMVDFVFVFDETNNHENIAQLKPDLYLKAGDYSKDQLTSRPLVEAYGGKVELIPFVQGRSTTELVTAIARSQGPIPLAVETRALNPRPTVFLDRDGTLIKHIEYLSEPSRVELLDGVGEGLRILQSKGFALVVVTNQPGIGLGYFSKEDFFAVNREFLRQVSQHGVGIDKIYFCPHSKSEQCSCRKPSTGLIERARAEVPVLPSASFMVGDMSSDIECGKRAGLRTVLVGTGRAGSDGLFDTLSDVSGDNFLACVGQILKLSGLNSA
jgi:rfaE bifunctional protein nucleotidyltransferase chain/domain